MTYGNMALVQVIILYSYLLKNKFVLLKIIELNILEVILKMEFYKSATKNYKTKPHNKYLYWNCFNVIFCAALDNRLFTINKIRRP